MKEIKNVKLGFNKKAEVIVKADVFMKPHPESVLKDDKRLLVAHVTWEDYSKAFHTKPDSKDWKPSVSHYFWGFVLHKNW